MPATTQSAPPGAKPQSVARWIVRSRDRRWRDTLAFVAHDLRNPLSVVRGAAVMLDTRLGDADPVARRRVEMIQRAVDRMVVMLDDLMLLAHPESEPRLPDRRRFAVAELLVGTVETYERSAADAGIRLSLEAAPDLCALGDARFVARVIENLLSNALRHTPSGGEIRIAAREVGAEIEVEIADTGTGVRPEDAAHVFDRFWTGPDGRARVAGLGLTISKHLVEANGGRISVDTGRERGAAFRFTIPAADPIP